MSDSSAELGPEDRELLDRVARRIVELHLEVPALLTLEGGRPLSLLAGQTLVFFEPLVTSFLRIADYRRFAGVIERRESVDHLMERIEAHADERHAARRGTGTADPPKPTAPSRPDPS